MVRVPTEVVKQRMQTGMFKTFSSTMKATFSEGERLVRSGCSVKVERDCVCCKPVSPFTSAVAITSRGSV